MPLDECRSCVRCLAYQDACEHGRATLTCRMAEPLGPPAQTTPSGAVVGLDVTCVEPDVLLGEVELRLPLDSAIVPVVAPDGTSLGAVGLHRHRQSPLAALRAMHELMGGTPRVIAEDAPLDLALRTMARARWRWISVVTRERRVSGILWDVQAMHHLFGGRAHLERATHLTRVVARRGLLPDR